MECAPRALRARELSGPRQQRWALCALTRHAHEGEPITADKNLVAGRLTMHRDGFGFVIPESKSLGQLKSKLTGDIFIPPHQIGND